MANFVKIVNKSCSVTDTYITKLADKGVGVLVLMALAGHKSIATTQRYIELNPTVMKATFELI